MAISFGIIFLIINFLISGGLLFGGIVLIFQTHENPCQTWKNLKTYVEINCMETSKINFTVYGSDPTAPQTFICEKPCTCFYSGNSKLYCFDMAPTDLINLSQQNGFILIIFGVGFMSLLALGRFLYNQIHISSENQEDEVGIKV
jgi:hypothetical protein